MFTGIVESVGQILVVNKEGANYHFQVSSDISTELRIDQSVSHQGVCLTVTELGAKSHWVTAINETLIKTNLANWSVGYQVNLERCMKADGRFDGHIVQGHVDVTAVVAQIANQNGSWLFTFEVENTKLIVEKGSVCINGTSLTCFNVNKNSFSIAIIPYTFENTTFNQLAIGDKVNVEFDILGKYVQKMMTNQSS